MDKRKRLMIAMSILLIILVVVFSTVAVRSSTVKKSINLGNKYVIEGNYEKAIVAFEKAIKIDKKNTYVKETLDVLYIYEEIIELVDQGELEKAQEKLEEIKDMPKFNIVEDSLKEVEDEIELNLNGLGNSIANIISGGRVAYDKEYAYYTAPSILNNRLKGLCKKNIETGEVTVIGEDNASNINVYDDYLYYTIVSQFEVEIIRIKKDGTNREVIASGGYDIEEVGDDNLSSDIQIIDNNLYYLIKINGNIDDSARWSLICKNLDTMEKKEVLQSDLPDMLLLKNVDNTIDLYMGASKVIRDIHSGNTNIESINTNEEISYIVGANKEGMYFTSYEEPIYFKSYDSDNYKKITNSVISNGAIISDTDIYFIEFDSNGSYDRVGKDKINKISIDNKEVSKVKDVSIKRQMYELDNYFNNLYEVKGYLAYYNGYGEFVIDKDIKIRNTKSSDTKLEEDEEVEVEEERDIISEISDSDFAKLNQLMSETLFDGYDRENPDIDQILYNTFKITEDDNYSYTTDSSGYIYDIKTIEAVDSKIKSLFNLEIDKTKITNDLEDVKNVNDPKIGFIDGKYYKLSSHGVPKVYNAKIAHSIIKKSDGTYLIEFTEYEADRPDHINWFSPTDFDRDFLSREQHLVTIGSGFAEVKEEVVNGETIHYFTKLEKN